MIMTTRTATWPTPITHHAPLNCPTPLIGFIQVGPTQTGSLLIINECKFLVPTVSLERLRKGLKTRA